MTLEEIKRDAPPLATHVDRIGYYFMKTDDGYFVYSKLGKGWSITPYNFSDAEIALYGIKPL